MWKRGAEGEAERRSGLLGREIEREGGRDGEEKEGTSVERGDGRRESPDAKTGYHSFISMHECMHHMRVYVLICTCICAYNLDATFHKSGCAQSHGGQRRHVTEALQHGGETLQNGGETEERRGRDGGERRHRTRGGPSHVLPHSHTYSHIHITFTQAPACIARTHSHTYTHQRVSHTRTLHTSNNTQQHTLRHLALGSLESSFAGA